MVVLDISFQLFASFIAAFSPTVAKKVTFKTLDQNFTEELVDFPTTNWIAQKV